MLTISKEQLAALAVKWEESRRAAFVARLRQELPDQVGALPEQELKKQVEDGCKAVDVLEIKDTEHIYRFLCLRYLPPYIWERPAAQEMLVRVLTDTSVDADRRLQFVETSIAVERP
jgi:hypothetical protein